MKSWWLVVLGCGVAHAERHVVERGETLDHVAAAHGCSVDAIERANKLQTSLVRPGTSLVIPSCPHARARDDDAKTRQAPAPRATDDDAKARQALAVIDGAAWTSASRGGATSAAVRNSASVGSPRSANAADIGASRNAGDSPTLRNAASDGVPRSATAAPDAADASRHAAASVGARNVSDTALRAANDGEPWHGQLAHGERLDAGDGYVVRRPTRAYGAAHVVEHLRHVIAEVRALYPDVHTLAIGDLSAEHGGKISDHRSHQSGLDVDVGFYFSRVPAGYPDSFAPADARLDLEATWALLVAFARTAERDDGVAIIFLDYDVQKRLYDWARARGTRDDELSFLLQYPHGADAMTGLVRHWPGHANHFHVRFKR